MGRTFPRTIFSSRSMFQAKSWNSGVIMFAALESCRPDVGDDEDGSRGRSGFALNGLETFCEKSPYHRGNVIFDKNRRFWFRSHFGSSHISSFFSPNKHLKTMSYFLSFVRFAARTPPGRFGFLTYEASKIKLREFLSSNFVLASFRTYFGRV